MGLDRRLKRLEEARVTDAPDACVVYEDGTATAYIYATGERMPWAEYARRWPDHPTPKAYLTWRLLEAV
ncbi:MAG: hypothetical protein AVDCRST_MAG88-486 [uncultured Thermomicrobiales bacterium]|uniref:Uncharacterized protein n=1 Tax=uncultured Thermomicrobiales bacterium TaxID=1645740 RepID=A0A6J4UDG5_9BACT|nr:MAG: hypothetical protein AVDCRST_MAG88-486 [uncultured Thermomicrobiales bacterium]